MKNKTRIFAALYFTLVWTALSAGRTYAAACEQLARIDHPNTTITLAESVPAGALKLNTGAGAPGGPPANYSRLPAFCRVAGTIKPTPDSDIRFEVWLPAENWNGKFVGVGNGVWAGAISYFEMAAPLMRGYATAATDDGHQGNPLDASFIAGHPEKLIDFGHRAPHEMTVVAKSAIKAFYGKDTQRSMFVSCSTGGRQGLMEAYRYPDDYDGISAMAPANPMVLLMISSLWTGYATLKDQSSMIPPPKFAVIHKAAVAACDADDGVQDGIISAPERCHFDPAALQCKGGDASDCLMAPQVAALHAIYDGPKNPHTGEQIYPGFEPGSESMFPFQTAGPLPFGAAFTFMRDVVFKDPQWDFHSFDYDHDVARARDGGNSAALDVPPEGLDKFFAKGHKLLLSHGWADGLIPARSSVNFYTGLTRRLGAKKSAAGTRLFMVPGMSHCAGGDGPFMFDAIATLDDWVASGHVPERIVVSNPPGVPARTRPLCPYPQEAVYSGNGSTDEEQNFTCKAR